MLLKKRDKSKLKLAVIAPVYNEEGNIKVFKDRLFTALEKAQISFNLYFVNDGSRDDSLLVLMQLAEQDKRVKVINLSRNFGHQLAVSAGLDYAEGDAFAIIDADLQDPPEVIPSLVDQWLEGYDVVNALRKSRKDGFLKRLSAEMFYKGLNLLLSHKIPENVGDFRLLDAGPVKTLRKMRERDRYIRGMTNWIGYKQTFVEFDRDVRYSGKTHYPIKKMLALAANALFSFSGFPIKLAYYAFGLFFLIATFVSLYAIYMKLAGLNVPGWTFEVLLIVVFGSIQMFVLAIIAEYVGRIYQQGQDRPLYVVSETVNTDSQMSKI